ncbi:hypothetical protein [Halomarina pelagica]|uniref:hypothetical protein n=1 Tax=Halomarina pelagica TaxID=2961599 RepID=UPI0020C309C7|nr:hypothetical protein [Halomarina sp. BND7]
MTAQDDPVQHCTLPESTDLHIALAATGIEHLEVDKHRIVVIYQQAILMIIATEGQIPTAREINVELWKEPPNSPTCDPNSLLAAFVDELLAASETVRR